MSRLISIFILLIFIVPAALALPESATREMVWRGYLFRDKDGDIRVGRPVIAMGVMERPAGVLGKDLAERLEPFVSQTRGDYFTEQDGGTYLKSVSLDDMLENWSDEDFIGHQARTKEKVEESERRRWERDERRKQDKSEVKPH